MIHNHNVKIIAFVGLAGSGKSTAAEYITKKGYPKVCFDNIATNVNENKFEKKQETNNVSAQIHNLINAGQHRIVVDGLYSWTEYKELAHEFAGELNVVAVVAPKKVRHRRLVNRPTNPLSQFEADQRDWNEIENLEKGGPIAIADHYITNDDDIDKLYNQIETLLREIEFTN